MFLVKEIFKSKEFQKEAPRKLKHIGSFSSRCASFCDKVFSQRRANRRVVRIKSDGMGDASTSLFSLERLVVFCRSKHSHGKPFQFLLAITYIN